MVLDTAVPYRRRRQSSSVRSWGATGVLPIALAFVASLSWMSYFFATGKGSPIERLPHCMLMMMGASALAVVIVTALSRHEQRVDDAGGDAGGTWDRRTRQNLREDSLRLDLMSTTLVAVELSCLLDIAAVIVDTFLRNLDPATVLAKPLAATFVIVMAMSAAAAVTEVIRKRNKEFRNSRRRYRQSMAQINNPWQRSLRTPVKTSGEARHEQIDAIVGNGPKYPDVPVVDASGRELEADATDVHDTGEEKAPVDLPVLLSKDEIGDVVPAVVEDEDDAETEDANAQEGIGGAMESVASAWDSAMQRSDAARERIDQALAAPKAKVADTARQVGSTTKGAATAALEVAACGIAAVARGIRKLLSDAARRCARAWERCSAGASEARKHWMAAADIADAEYEPTGDEDAKTREERDGDSPESC